MGIFTGRFMRSNSPRSATRLHCFGKKRLSDPNWQYLPFLTANYIEHAAGPNIGQAEFESYFGLQIKGSHGLNYWDFYYPYTINGSFILVTAQNSFFNSGPVSPMGIYQINNENVEQYSHDTYPTGKQTFNGLELSSILDRIFISFSIVKNDDNVLLQIPTMKIFNDNLISSNVNTGNRSSTKIGGAYYFDDRPNGNQTAWSNYDILEYFLTHFINTETNSISWEIDGEGIEVLNSIYSKFDPSGKSLLTIFDELISKNFGLGFGIDFNFNTNTPVLRIFSKFPPGVFSNSARGTYRYINLDNPGVISNSLSFDEGAVYDRIHVIGGPIYTTSTFSFYNNNLVENWNLNDEGEYLGLSGTYPVVSLEEMDEERSKEKYSSVYNNFKIPTNWNGVVFNFTLPGDIYGTTTQNYPTGQNLFPEIEPYSGFLDFTYDVSPYYWGKKFEDNLPFVDGEKQNLQPFVGIAADKADIDNLSVSELKYFKVTDLGNIGLNSANFSVENNQLAFKLDVNPNYIMAKDRIIIDDGTAYWSENSSVEIDMTLMDGDKIKLKYENIFITATVNTGNKINLIRDARTTYETKRVKVIDMGDAFNLHYIAPQTISEIIPSPYEENFNDITYNQNPYIYKNDMAKIRNIMYLALAVYGVPRAVCSFTAADPLYNFRVGDYIVADVSKAGVTYINQNITSIRRSVTNAGVETEIMTSHEEVDFNTIYANMLDFKFGDFNKNEWAIGANPNDVRKIITPKKGQSPGKDITMVTDFPAIPTTKTRYIYLKNSEVDPINEQIWEGIPGDNRWRPTVKHSTLNGFPNEIGDMS